jgi:uncharacterized protein YidB (DUF937 family)
MGLLDSVIGALSGIRGSGGSGDLLPAVLGMLADDGGGPGMRELTRRFERHGLSDVMASWIGCDDNLPIAPDVLQTVLGRDTIARLGDALGLAPRTTAERLARMLPYVIDKLTPDGIVPPEGLGDTGQLMGRIGRL